jgi:hypothetical protein
MHSENIRKRGHNCNPLLQVPPASRGNRAGARHGSPREAGGEPAGAGKGTAIRFRNMVLQGNFFPTRGMESPLTPTLSPLDKADKGTSLEFTVCEARTLFRPHPQPLSHCVGEGCRGARRCALQRVPPLPQAGEGDKGGEGNTAHLSVHACAGKNSPCFKDFVPNRCTLTSLDKGGEGREWGDSACENPPSRAPNECGWCTLVRPAGGGR